MGGVLATVGYGAHGLFLRGDGGLELASSSGATHWVRLVINLGARLRYADTARVLRWT